MHESDSETRACELNVPSVSNDEYVLGTGDAEIERLRLQHTVWRADAALAWRTARFGPGQTLLDVGCGPGHATFDLADIVGPTGQVIGLDQSRRFLDYLERTSRARGHGNIRAIQSDLDTFDLAGIQANGAWLRWILAFVRQPKRLLE